jgi:outer membrane protein OmpA-like peptidoglycan-associated protein
MTSPTLSDDGLASLPCGENGADAQTDRWFNNIVVAENRHPMTRQFMNWLRDRLATSLINEKLERFFSISASGAAGDTNRNRQARAFDDYIGLVFSTDPSRGNQGWHPDDLDQARLTGRLLLATRQWTYDDTSRSHLEWIQILLNRFSSSPLGVHSRPLRNIQNHLGLEPRDPDEDDIYEYEVELVVGGLAGTVVIGLGGYIGSLNITAWRNGRAARRWTQSYLVWFGGFSAGASFDLNAGFRTTGSGSSAHPWTPTEIPGSIILSSGPSIAAGGGVGGGYGASVLTLFGNGVHTPLVIDLSGWSMEAEIGGGVTLIASSWGYCHSPGRRSWDSRRRGDEFVQPGDRDYTVDAELQDEVHFEFGDSFLTEEGRQALRILCATELVCFDSTGSRIVVHGHADRVDTPERNQRLSRLRAENTITAIHDILGEHLGVHSRNRRVIAHGESEAAREGEPDRLRNPERRRVDIVLNTRFTAALRGAAHPPRGGGQG